jgi:hypothetical protein
VVKTFIDLRTFDHDTCDMLLAQRGISIGDVFYASKGANSRLIWEMTALALFVVSSRNSDRRRLARAFRIFSLIGLVAIAINLDAMRQYSQACRHFWPA